jgi:predicted aspartyl protease
MNSTEEMNGVRFTIEVELANNSDVARSHAGTISPDDVRRIRVPGIVGSRAMRLVISEAVAERLGLEMSGTTKACYPDGSSSKCALAHVHLSYGCRDGVFNAVVEPGRAVALIGSIVLDDLDYVIDCLGGCLIPRDPEYITSEA